MISSTSGPVSTMGGSQLLGSTPDGVGSLHDSMATATRAAAGPSLAPDSRLWRWLGHQASTPAAQPSHQQQPVNQAPEAHSVSSAASTAQLKAPSSISHTNPSTPGSNPGAAGAAPRFSAEGTLAADQTPQQDQAAAEHTAQPQQQPAQAPDTSSIPCTDASAPSSSLAAASPSVENTLAAGQAPQQHRAPDKDTTQQQAPDQALLQDQATAAEAAQEQQAAEQAVAYRALVQRTIDASSRCLAWFAGTADAPGLADILQDLSEVNNALAAWPPIPQLSLGDQQQVQGAAGQPVQQPHSSSKQQQAQGNGSTRPIPTSADRLAVSRAVFAAAKAAGQPLAGKAAGQPLAGNHLRSQRPPGKEPHHFRLQLVQLLSLMVQPEQGPTCHLGRVADVAMLPLAYMRKGTYWWKHMSRAGAVETVDDMILVSSLCATLVWLACRGQERAWGGTGGLLVNDSTARAVALLTWLLEKEGHMHQRPAPPLPQPQTPQQEQPQQPQQQQPQQQLQQLQQTLPQQPLPQQPQQPQPVAAGSSGRLQQLQQRCTTEWLQGVVEVLASGDGPSWGPGMRDFRCFKLIGDWLEVDISTPRLTVMPWALGSRDSLCRTTQTTTPK